MQRFSTVYAALVLVAMLVLSVTILPLRLVQSHAFGSLRSAESSGIEVTDWRNKTIVLPEFPEKIISLADPCTVMLYALGAGDKVAGVDKYSIDDAKAGPSTFREAPGEFERYVEFCDEVSDKPNLGSSWYPSVEPLLGIEPDVVFMYYYSGTLDEIEALEQLGIPVIGIVAETPSDIYRLIRLIGEVADAQEEADALVSEMESRLDIITGKVENLTRPKVYIEPTKEFRTVGGDTFSDWMIETAGGENIFKELSGFPSVSSEDVIVRNPDVIIFEHYLPVAKRVLEEGRNVVDVLLEMRPAWKDIKAVKDCRVHILPTYYATYDQRFVIGVELMAKWFHAGFFSIEKTIEKPITYIGPGASASINIEGIAITQVMITAAPGKCIGGAMLSIRQLSPDVSLTLWNVSAPETPGFTVYIYKYLEVKLEPWVPENISEVKLSFHVENSWLEANGLSEVDVAIFRWNETTEFWDEIKVNSLYEATLPGLSMFAIAGIKSPPPPIWAQPWLWGIVAVIAILTLIAVLRLRMSRRPKPN